MENSLKGKSFKSLNPKEYAKEAGGYTQVYNNVIETKELRPSHLLTYAAIKLMGDGREIVIWNKAISNLTGYSERTIVRHTDELVNVRLIRKEVIEYPNGKRSYNTKNKYTFPDDNDDIHYEPHTRLFLENKKISCLTKAFIIMLQPHLLKNKFGNDYTYMNQKQIIEAVRISKPKVKECIDELIALKYWRSDKSTIYVELTSIQLDGALDVIKEKDYLTDELIKKDAEIARLKENQITPEIKDVLKTLLK